MARSSGWLKVRGLDCPTEEARIREALEAWPGLAALEFDLGKGVVRLEYDDARTDLNALAEAIENRCGYGCSKVADPVRTEARAAADGDSRRWIWDRGKWVLAAAAAGAAGFAAGLIGSESAAKVCYAVSLAFSAMWIAPKAADATKRGRLDIFTLVTLAMAGAASLGQWDEAATVGVLFGVSELLEAYASRRAKVSIQALIDLTPERAERLERNGTVVEVDPLVLVPGDHVRVRPGQKVPVDGSVTDGSGHIDQSIITGESMPVLVGPGTEVYAGTINAEGLLTVEVRKPWGECAVQRIARRVQEARAVRAPIERLVDRFARIYTPAVVILASLVAMVPPLLAISSGHPAAWSEWVLRGLVLLVISCPCALVIATPVAIVSALANAAKNGILVRDGGVIERFGKLSVIAFDKTGTLTLGRPDVVQTEHLHAESSADELLVKAAAVGRGGSHLVSKAIVRHAHSRDLEIPEATQVSEHPGLGAAGTVRNERILVGSHRYLDQSGLCDSRFHDRLAALETEVGTAVAIANEHGPLGWIRLADRPRPEAALAIAGLKQLGLSTMMITGDNQATATAIGGSLGIDDISAGLMPEEKADIVRDVVARSGLVGMVGDGVNDAPALAAASVGVCMGTVAGAVTSQAADVVLVNDSLMSLPRLVSLSRATVGVIRTNVAFALATKVIVVILAILGLAGFWMAMAADVGVSLIVVAHAMTLLRHQPR